MFSRDIIIRTGESPHLIFDRNTGEYLDISGNVLIGDHVWVGERAYLTKHACIPNECIVAASSVVTKKFLEEGSVIAGNPAKIVKSNVKWMRNKSFIDPNSVYHEKYYEYLNELDN